MRRWVDKISPNLRLAKGMTALAMLWIPALTGGAMAQSGGDVMNGHAIAQRICGECHAVNSGQTRSPHPQVPTFTAVANTPGRTGASLRVWFQSPHRSMPDLVLRESDSDDLVAYILSLAKPASR